ELAKGTPDDPDNVAPLVVFLASDAAQHVNGHLFWSLGFRIGLVSQPKIVKQLRFDHRPSVDELAEYIPRAFGPDLVEIKNEPNDPDFAQMEGKWVEVRPGLSFCGTQLEPYGEQLW